MMISLPANANLKPSILPIKNARLDLVSGLPWEAIDADWVFDLRGSVSWNVILALLALIAKRQVRNIAAIML